MHYVQNWCKTEWSDFTYVSKYISLFFITIFNAVGENSCHIHHVTVYLKSSLNPDKNNYTSCPLLIRKLIHCIWYYYRIRINWRYTLMHIVICLLEMSATPLFVSFYVGMLTNKWPINFLYKIGFDQNTIRKTYTIKRRNCEYWPVFTRFSIPLLLFTAIYWKYSFSRIGAYELIIKWLVCQFITITLYLLALEIHSWLIKEDRQRNLKSNKDYK